MALVAPYVDGKLQTTTTSSDSLSATSSNNKTVDSDTFLTLLVAEMQNQDPLEPTSNTEWVSQYATFTQVEQMGEMADSMDMLRANSLIGQEVVMKVTSTTTGETTYKTGVVDYIVIESGEPLLVIDEEKYALGDLDTVASSQYMEAYDLYTEFTKKVNALPPLGLIDKSYESTVRDLYEMYQGMTDYQQAFVEKYSADTVISYKAYVTKLEELGITFEEEVEEEKPASLDDILEAFNQKMEALMEQMKTQSSQNTTTDNTGDTGDTDTSGDTDTTDTDKVTDTDNTGDTDTSGDTDTTDTDKVTDTDNTGDTDTSGNTDTTGSTESLENTENTTKEPNDAEISEEILNQLTQNAKEA